MDASLSIEHERLAAGLRDCRLDCAHARDHRPDETRAHGEPSHVPLFPVFAVHFCLPLF
jgi:hypothetical protein